MNAIQTFDFESQPIRSFEREGMMWFVAADVCRAIGIANSRDAVSRLDDDEKGVGSTDTPGGTQELTVISEGGLYTIILRCREATTPGSLPHRFRKWVTAEVLPALRRTGRYAMAEDAAPASTLDFERLNTLTNLVGEARRVYGRAAARAMWERLPLPQVRSATAGALYEAPEDDSHGCLAHLLRVALDNGVSVRSAIDAAWGDATRRAWLSERGIKVVAGGRRESVAVAERHPFLAQAFAGTPWADDWFMPLLALDAARASPSPLDFGRGAGGKPHRSRSVLIPKTLLQMTRVM